MDERYNNDAPVVQFEHDRFNRAPFARRVADVIISRKDASCLVIGIFGKWGSGKTSVLNLIEAVLIPQEVVCIRYNPWRYTGEDAMLMGFYNELAYSVGKKLATRGEEAGRLIKKWGSVLDSFAGRAGTADKVGDLLDKAGPEEYKKRTDQTLAEFNTKVVVFIDDIDRLDTAEMSAIFRLVKLNADFPNTIYVLAFDDELVARTLGMRYGSSITDGRSFLEKIIQVPLSLPQIPGYQLAEFCVEEIRRIRLENQIDLSEQDRQRFSDGYSSGLSPMLGTPRMARLYANILQFSIPLLRGEVNPVDLILTEGIRTIYPALHTAIWRNPGLFLVDARNYGDYDFASLRDRLNSIITDSTSDLRETELEGVHKLLGNLFPGIAGVLGVRVKPMWDLKRQLVNDKRIGSWDYFDRYFSYSVPAADVSDLKVSHLLRTAGELSSNQIVDELRLILKDDRRVVPLILKLSRDWSLLSGNAIAAQVFAEAVASCGEYWIGWRGILSEYDTPTELAAAFISNCLRQIPNEGQRSITASRIILDLAPVPLALGVVGKMYLYADDDGRSGEEEEDGDNGSYSPLEQALMARISQAAKTEDFFERFGALEAVSLLFNWNYRDRAAATDYLRRLLVQSPRTGSQLLRELLFRYQGNYLPKRRFRIDKEVFDALCKLADPTDVLKAIQASSSLEPQVNDDRERNDGELAHDLERYMQEQRESQTGELPAGYSDPGSSAET